MIVISEIDGHPVSVSAARPTLVCWHADRAGFLAGLTKLFAEATLNIVSITTSRKTRGGAALTVVEIDDLPTPPLIGEVVKLPDITRIVLVPALP